MNGTLPISGCAPSIYFRMRTQIEKRKKKNIKIHVIIICSLNSLRKREKDIRHVILSCHKKKQEAARPFLMLLSDYHQKSK